jgi:CubicO group peptidase (beta-lactamase class C family)
MTQSNFNESRLIPAPVGAHLAPSRRAVLAGIAGAALSPGALLAKSAPSSILAEALAAGATPGMAALVIRSFKAKGELVAGVRRLGETAPARRGDRWHLGSDGKAMTATLVARLVERGVLSWEAPLEAMLPDFANEMHADYRDVTLVDLLSHRAGLPENHDDLEFFNSFYDDPAPLPAQRLRYIRTALGDAPAGPKRAEPSYSNTGFIIAGAIAEQAAGKPYEELIMAEVFHPLRMRTVDFGQYGGAGEPVGHVDGRVANEPHDANPRMIAPAGGMRMSLEDWGRFCIDQMRGEHGQGRLLKTATYHFLHAGQGGTRSALGWGAAPSVMGLQGPALTHAGSDGNWEALVVLFPETGNGVLVVANAFESMGGDKAARTAVKALAEGVAAPAAP